MNTLDIKTLFYGSILFLILIPLSPASELVYSTLLGGSGFDFALDIALDTAGNAYITGNSFSDDFPTTIGVFDRTYNGGRDVFIAKFSPDGSWLEYATYLGGSNDDVGLCIALDSAGYIYLTGYTFSIDFPVTPSAYDRIYNDYCDAFVTKLTPEGDGLIYSTFLGGIDEERGYGIAVDTTGSAYITGYTFSPNFPTTIGAYDRTYNYLGDAFITKLNPAGSALSFSTFLGGGDEDVAYDIELDPDNNVYVTGYTYSINFPTTLGAFDRTFNGANDIFISKINTTGSSLVYSTYLGGVDNDCGFGLARDTSGNIYVTGFSASPDFPTTAGAYQRYYFGDDDIIVARLNADLSSLYYSTFIGGGGWDYGYDIEVDKLKRAYITGYTGSYYYFPTTIDAFQRVHYGFTDAFIAHLSSSGQSIIYSSLIGGEFIEEAYGLAIDDSGNAVIAGYTRSPDYFPTTPGVFSENYQGLCDVFVAKFNTLLTINDVFYADANQNSVVDQGDILIVQFDRDMSVNSATTADFYLPVAGDKLGSGATVTLNLENESQLIITFGSSPKITINGLFTGATTSGSPSALDISATMTVNAIEATSGIDAQDHGRLDVNDTGVDILSVFIPITRFVNAYSPATVQVGSDTTNDYYTKHRLVIPTNSLTTSANITITTPTDAKGKLDAVALSPTNVTFSSSTPSTIVLEYKNMDIQREQGYMENAMRIHQWKDSATGWVPVPQTYSRQSVDPLSQTVSVKINKFNMVGATGSFAANTNIVYANIAIPTVGAKTATVAYTPTGFIDLYDVIARSEATKQSENGIASLPLAKTAEEQVVIARNEMTKQSDNYYFAASTSISISVGTTGIYTKHKLTLSKYTTAYSGVTITLAQASLDEMHGWQNYAIMKLATSSGITTQANLTLEYKDHTDSYNQYKNDIINGAELQMRVHRWREDLGTWEKMPGAQSLDLKNNLVTAAIDTLSLSQIYAVGVDTTLVLTSYGAFTGGEDTSYWYFEKYGDGSAAGTLSWLENYAGRAGVIKMNQSPGQKAKFTQLFSVPSTGWYTARAKVATDITDTSKQQKVYLYLQQLDSNTAVVATANQVIASGSGGLGSANTWRDMEIALYAKGTSLAVQVVGINPGSSGVTGSLYVDDVLVLSGVALATTVVSLNNPNFSSNTAGWIFQVYGDAGSMGTWSWVSSLSGRSGILKGNQSANQKAKISQNFSSATAIGNILGSVWVYSSATSSANTQKLYLYIYSLDNSYTKIIESGNAILQPGKWTPGQWQQLQFGYAPYSKYNAVQLVGINPSGKPTQTIYFDDVVVKQD